MWYLKITLISESFQIQLRQLTKVYNFKVLVISLIFVIMILFGFQNYVITANNS